MFGEKVDGVVVDRCARCGGIWFDATEPDQRLALAGPPGASPLEARIPGRGRSSRLCPHCKNALASSGWDGRVLNRCASCRGLFLDLSEWRYLKENHAPHTLVAFEEQFKWAVISAGENLLLAKGIVHLVWRLLK
jgi:Zn-finger nucleic acid-binding protein